MSEITANTKLADIQTTKNSINLPLIFNNNKTSKTQNMSNDIPNKKRIFFAHKISSYNNIIDSSINKLFGIPDNYLKKEIDGVKIEFNGKYIKNKVGYNMYSKKKNKLLSITNNNNGNNSEKNNYNNKKEESDNNKINSIIDDITNIKCIKNKKDNDINDDNKNNNNNQNTEKYIINQKSLENLYNRYKIIANKNKNYRKINKTNKNFSYGYDVDRMLDLQEKIISSNSTNEQSVFKLSKHISENIGKNKLKYRKIENRSRDNLLMNSQLSYRIHKEYNEFTSKHKKIEENYNMDRCINEWMMNLRLYRNANNMDNKFKITNDNLDDSLMTYDENRNKRKLNYEQLMRKIENRIHGKILRRCNKNHMNIDNPNNKNLKKTNSMMNIRDNKYINMDSNNKKFNTNFSRNINSPKSTNTSKILNESNFSSKEYEYHPIYVKVNKKDPFSLYFNMVPKDKFCVQENIRDAYYSPSFKDKNIKKYMEMGKFIELKIEGKNLLDTEINNFKNMNSKSMVMIKKKYRNEDIKDEVYCQDENSIYNNDSKTMKNAMNIHYQM